MSAPFQSSLVNSKSLKKGKRHLAFVSALLMSLSSSCLHYRQYHQEIEDFVFNLVQKYEEQKRGEQEKTHFNVKPQVL